jgi:hypothetical protein
MNASVIVFVACFDASSPSDSEFLEVPLQSLSDSDVLEKCEAES